MAEEGESSAVVELRFGGGVAGGLVGSRSVSGSCVDAEEDVVAGLLPKPLSSALSLRFFMKSMLPGSQIGWHNPEGVL